MKFSDLEFKPHRFEHGIHVKYEVDPIMGQVSKLGGGQRKLNTFNTSILRK